MRQIFKRIIQHYQKMDEKHLILNGFYTLAGGSVLLTLSNRISQHQGLIHVFAPKTGPYHFLYIHGTKHLETFLMQLINNWHISTAMAIVLFIIAIRLIFVFPLDMYLTKRSRETNEKSKLLKPQLKAIHDIIAYQPVTSAQRKKLDDLRNQVLMKNHAKVSTTLLVLVIVIETVVGIALYQMVAYSPDLAKSQFLGINLGSRSWSLAFATAIISLIGNVVRISGYTDYQKQNVTLINYIMSPISILASGLFFPAVITLYLFTTQCLLLIQNIIEYHILRKYIENKYKKQQNQKVVTIVTQEKLDKIMQKS